MSGDGFAHPAGEDEIVALVRRAARGRRRLRVRGAAHSVAHAVYTDPVSDLPNRVGRQAPPGGDGIDVMLDRHRGWRVIDEARKLVEVDAGTHLGRDPHGPAGEARLEDSLLWQLAHEKGWSLPHTGGITHQTVGGFTATASSGGSLQRSANRSLWGFRVVDGRGDVHELTRDDADPDLFYASAPSMGLLGVVSAVTFECVDAFEIAGQEATTTLEDCSVDVFGDAGDGRPSLERFLREAEFARLEWWPQRGAERIQTWQAQRLARQPGFRPKRYQRFGQRPQRTQHFTSIFYTILGNLDDLSQARERLEDDFEHLEDALEVLARARGTGVAGRLLAKGLAQAAELGVDALITVLQPAAPLLRRELPDLFPRLLAAFLPLDSEKEGIERGEPQSFRDHGWQGLPMDNAASDVLLPTAFTELWIPLTRTRETMQLLREYFRAPADGAEAYRRTGTCTWELYAAMPDRFWLSPAYSGGDDEWRDGAFRVDPYWFGDSAEDPAETIFARLWSAVRDAGIPFRLHWGKYQPVYAPGDRGWADFFRAQYPRWDDFLALRAERDPDGIFLTRYWRDRFGLWDA